jgi:hypothetical protein
MRTIELSCAAIVALYVTLRLRAAGDAKRDVVVRLLALSCAAWVGEDSVIRAYGFYSYASGWSVFVDRVPLLIVAIWPVVIDSAHALAQKFARGGVRVALVGGCIVLADASLIEPIAVHANLWTWTASEPRALFDVPLIGVAGWAFFAAAAMATFEARKRSKAPSWCDAIAIVTAPLATHAVLVATWWCVFRWFGETTPTWAPAIAAWCILVPLTFAAWHRGATIPLATVMARAPGAVFFFAILATTARDRPDLVAYAMAFAPPYLALSFRAGAMRAMTD